MTTVRVFALGGSILSPTTPDEAYAAGFARLIGERVARGEKALIVTGGGGPARQYIRAGRALGLTEAELDRIGIAATRLNARFLVGVLRHLVGPGVADAVPERTEDTAALLGQHVAAVMGGTEPGHSTDYVAAALATAAGADHLYILTNVDGVYTADPKLHPDAERLPELSSARLLEIVGEGWTAGKTGIMDPRCAHHVHDHRLPATVLDGRDLDNLRRDLQGERSGGSIIHPATG